MQVEKCKNGFTVIEILVAITIIVLVIIFTSYISVRLLQKSRIDASSVIIQSTLDSARNKSVTAQEGRAYGVKFIPGGSTITTVSQGISSDPIEDIKQISLNKGVTLTSSNITILFSKLTGRVLLYDGFSLVNLTNPLQVTIASSAYRLTITIDPSGRITASTIQSL